MSHNSKACLRLQTWRTTRLLCRSAWHDPLTVVIRRAKRLSYYPLGSERTISSVQYRTKPTQAINSAGLSILASRHELPCTSVNRLDPRECRPLSVPQEPLREFNATGLLAEVPGWRGAAKFAWLARSNCRSERTCQEMLVKLTRSRAALTNACTTYTTETARACPHPGKNSSQERSAG